MFGQNFKKPMDNYGAQQKRCKDMGLEIASGIGSHFIKDPKRTVPPVLSLFLMFWLMGAYIIKNIDDLEDISEPLILLMAGFLTSAKFILFFWNILKFRTLKYQLETLSADASPAEKLIWQQYVERGQKLVICLDSLLVVSLIGLILRPFLGFMINYFENGTFELKLPLKGLYPYNQDAPVFFVFTFCMNFYAAYFVTNVVIIVDGTLCWLVFAVSAHFGILREKLKSLGEKILIQKSSKQFQRELTKIIYYQQNVYKWVASFNGIFFWITFLKISICILQFCFIIFLWNTEIDILLRINMSTVAASMLLQIALYCFGGEKIGNESELTCEAIYLSMPVEYMEPDMKRLLINFLLCTQKPVELQGGYFFVANRTLFVSIIKTAFSYAAVIAQK